MPFEACTTFKFTYIQGRHYVPAIKKIKSDSKFS